MKLKKRSGLIGALIGLSSVALVSVGFASWIITTGDKNEDTTGSLVVDTVTDQRHLIALTVSETFDDTNHVIGTAATKDETLGYRVSFGPNDNTSTGKWLYDTDSTKNQRLVYYFQVVVSNVVKGANPNQIFVGSDGTTAGLPYLTVTDNSNDGYAKASAAAAVANSKTATSAYITAGTVTYWNGSSWADNISSAAWLNASAAYNGVASRSSLADNAVADAVMVFKLEFGWGAAFGGQNPYNYYNAKTATANSSTVVNTKTLTWGDEAKLFLEELNSLLTGVSYKLTIQTKANN